MGWYMVRECFGSQCQEQLHSFNAGHLYILERRHADAEFFWLCPACATRFGLVLDEHGDVSLAERTGGTLRTPPHPERDLRRYLFRQHSRQEFDTIPPHKPTASAGADSHQEPVTLRKREILDRQIA